MKKENILIVDDESTNISILVEILKDTYNLLVATDAVTALEIANSNEDIDLILLDIVMPDIDGYEVAYKLKHTEKTSGIPIIFLTAKNDEKSIIKGFKRGAVDYISKPFAKEELLVRVNTHLKVHRLNMELANALDDLHVKMDKLSELEQRFETIFNKSPNGIALIDLDTNFVLVNDSYSRITGFTKEELFTKSCMELTEEKDRESSKEILKKVLDIGYVEDFEKRCKGKNKIFEAKTSITLMPDKKRFLLNMNDITKLKNAEKKIAKYLDIMDKNVISSSTDLDGIITEVSEAFCNLSGYSRDEFIGKKHNFLKHSDMKDETYKGMWDSLVSNKIWHGEVKNIKKDGSVFWFNVTIVPIFNDDNIKTGYMAIREDITDKKRIEELSITDELTSLYNRRYFNDVFEKELNRAKRKNTSISLLMLDVDYFKLYNDTYGHQDGDNVLSKIGGILNDFSKRAGDFAFRLGGEEFGILFHEDSFEEADQFANNLLKAVEKLKIPHDKSLTSKFVTVSIGLVHRDVDKATILEDVYKQVDDNLYKAKELGRNRVVST
ncbi:PAS domain S-box protein [Sulfurimonas sp.]|uniref:GGDEF domain-containing response regulator n=1 Tax=Sulfurimonas sp. TaxID=2022749 RepID=UPI0035621258